MDNYFVALGSAVWLGILTSISPCPLATNIAAISYIGKRVDSPTKVLLAGLIYTLGRMIAYILLGVIVVSSILSIPEIANFLQRNMNRLLGPILLVVGILLLDLIPIRFSGGGVNDRLTHRIEKLGIWGAGLMGLLFALSFCPVSAALFFGSLIPIAIDHNSAVVMPTVYGFGTALPVVAFAILIALGARFVGSIFNRVSIFEKYARKLTAIAFILVGLYYSLIYLAGINL